MASGSALFVGIVPYKSCCQTFLWGVFRQIEPCRAISAGERREMAGRRSESGRNGGVGHHCQDLLAGFVQIAKEGAKQDRKCKKGMFRGKENPGRSESGRNGGVGHHCQDLLAGFVQIAKEGAKQDRKCKKGMFRGKENPGCPWYNEANANCPAFVCADAGGREIYSAKQRRMPL